MSTRLSSLLVQDGLVSAKRVADALQRQVIHGGTLDSNLLDIKAIEEDLLITYLGRASGLPTQPTGIVASGAPQSAVLELFTDEIAQRFHAVPTTLLTGGVLQVLVTDEVEISDMDTLALTVKQRIEPWVSFEFRFVEAMDKVYGRAMPTRFARLLARSIAAHEAQGKAWPAPRLIDPIPRFGSLSDQRLPGPPPPVAAEAKPAVVEAKPAVAEAKPAVAEAKPVVAEAKPAVEEVKPAVAEVKPVVAEAKPAVAEAKPVVAEAKPVVAEAKPVVAEAKPVVAEAKPAVAEAKPVVAEAKPAVAEAKPAVAEKKPVAAEAKPVVAEAKPAVAEKKPVAAEAKPVVAEAKLVVAEAKPVVAEAKPVTAEVKPVVVEAKPVVVEAAAPQPPVAAAPAVVATPPAAVAAPVANTPDPAAPLPSSQSAPRTGEPSFVGIEDISLDEWMSAADWLSAANKVPPAANAADAATASAKHAAAAHATAAAQPTPPVALASAAKPAPTAPPAAAQTAEKTAHPATPTPAPTASTPSSASPGKRKGKRHKGGKDAPPVAAKPAPVVTAPAKPAAPVAPPVAAKPAAAAASQSKPAVAPVPSAQPKPVATPPVAAASSQPAAVPVAAKPAVTSPPLPGVITPPTALESARTPETAPPAFVEAVPVAVDSGRLGNQVSKVSAVAEKPPVVTAPVAVTPPPVDQVVAPPPSSESPLPELGPAPRIAVALDEAGGDSPISLEAARELVGSATERDPIFEAACRGVRSRVAFVAVFTIHGEVAFGRMALGDKWLDRQSVGRVSVQLDRTSAFRAVAKGRLPFVGYVGEEAAASDPLRALERKAPLSAAVLPILLRGKPVALIYFDDDGREVSTQLVEELQPLISEIGQSFQRFLQGAKTGGLGASEGDEPAPQEVQDSATSALRPRESRVESAVEKPIAEQPTTRLETAAPSQPAAKQEAAPTAPLSALPTLPIGKTSEKPAAKPEGKAEAKPEVKVEAKAEVKAEVKVEAKPEGKAEGKPEGKTESRGKAGRRGAQKSPPSSSASPSSTATANVPATAAASATASASSKGAITTTDLTSLLEKAASAPRDQAALRDILIIGQPAVKPLIDRLKDASTSTRMRLAIVLCLAELPVPIALEPLGERLFDSDEEVRTAAAVALRSFPPSSALSTLRSRMRDALDGGDAKGVQHAVEALGELRDTPAVPQLIELLEHADPRVVDAVGRALQNITKQDFGRSRFRWSGWWRRHQSEPRLQWLLAGLCHPSALIRSSAQDELFEMSGDVASYRYDQPSSERDQAARRWVDWWQAHGYDVI